MPATVPTRGVLKASTNRVRTSVALQGNAMWENVIGIVNEHAGANQGVEALINAPTHGGGRKRSAAARAAAAEAVLATGGFDTAITNYESLLSLAKSQGAVGGGNSRGACKVCGQLGHLTKQCRNQFSKYYQPEAAAAGGGEARPSGVAVAEPAAAGEEVSDLSGLSSDSSDEERRRKKEKRKRKHKSKDRKHKKKSRKEKKEKKSSKHKSKRRKHSSGSGSDSSSSSDSD